MTTLKEGKKLRNTPGIGIVEENNRIQDANDRTGVLPIGETPYNDLYLAFM